MKTSDLSQIWRNPIHFVAFGFGAGVSPIMPGTCGTLVAIPLYLLIAPLPLLEYGLLVLACFFGGIWLCGKTSKDLKVHDHPGIVWDEIVGFFITLFMVPVTWWWILTGFVLFRCFDIWKPWPIGWLDKKVSGGTGIMLDDVIAGVYAWVILQLLVYFF